MENYFTWAYYNSQTNAIITMPKTKGFTLPRKLVKVFRCCVHRRRRATAYRRLERPAGTISILRKWAHSLSRGARGLCPGKSHRRGYVRIGEEPVDDERPKLPKGHLVVYVGDREEDTSPVAVPVLYFNHPLFGELLRETEKVYGFDYPGGIQIPCPKSKLENVQMEIEAASGGRNPAVGGSYRMDSTSL